MTRALFLAVLKRAADSWRAGDAAAAADCFAEDVEYLDPYRYRFTRRADLLPFFRPPTGGQHVVWHSILWDDEARTGVVEYTYEGDHRYHGAAIVRLDADGRIALSSCNECSGPYAVSRAGVLTLDPALVCTRRGCAEGATELEREVVGPLQVRRDGEYLVLDGGAGGRQILLLPDPEAPVGAAASVD